MSATAPKNTNIATLFRLGHLTDPDIELKIATFHSDNGLKEFDFPVAPPPDDSRGRTDMTAGELLGVIQRDNQSARLWICPRQYPVEPMIVVIVVRPDGEVLHGDVTAVFQGTPDSSPPSPNPDDSEPETSA